VTRPYHSPSSIALGLNCQHAYALQYIDGKRDADLPWREEFTTLKWDHGLGLFVLPRTGERVTAAQRGASLGKALHATAERWYEPARGVADWGWFPGQVLASGKHLLPEPSAIERVVIEQPIGDTDLYADGRVGMAEALRAGKPTTAIEVEGILWSGFVDLEAHGGDELARLGITAPDGVAIIDYKSTSKIESYALTRDELLKDPQAALYAIAVGRKLGLTSVPERWVYFESKAKRRALPIDVTAELSRALDVIGPCADLARELDMISHSGDAPKNLSACKKYGPPDRINCRRHISNGGTCDAKHKRFGAPIQLVVKKKEIHDMATQISNEERKAKFEARRAALAAEAEAAKTSGSVAIDEAAEEPEAEAADEEPTDEAETVEPTPATAKPATAKPAPAAKPVAAKAVKPAEGSQAATIAALAAELAAADKARAEVLERLRKAVA